MFIRRSLPLCLLLISSAALSQSAPTLTVSPGGLLGATQIADGCATFSWGPVDGATGYQVAVFDMMLDNSNDLQAQVEEIEPVLETTIAAPALSWTPATGQCLDQGGSYLWFVRATTEDGEEEWSEGRYFEVDYSGSVLAEAVAQEVTIQLKQPDTWRRVVQEALQAEPRVTLPQPPYAGKPAVVPQTSAGVVGEPSGDKMDSRGSTKGVSTNALTLVNPVAFRVSSGAGVVFDHPTWPYSGDIPVEGEGRRFMWYPGKGALRAGYDDVNRWDDVHIGTFSVAMGNGPVASGGGSVALGDHTVASGAASTAMGSSSVASGKKSTAMGAAKTIASGDFSTAMGFGTTAKSAYETAIGSYNTEYTPLSTTGWRVTDRLFVIGNSSAHSARSDALVVLKNGNVGIGTSTPNVRLQVAGGSDCKPGSGGHIATNYIDFPNIKSICIDDNEIMARYNGFPSTLFLNNDGGLTSVGGNLWIGGTTQLVLDAAGATDVCRNGSGKLSFCSSSGRYKEPPQTGPTVAVFSSTPFQSGTRAALLGKNSASPAPVIRIEVAVDVAVADCPVFRPKAQSRAIKLAKKTGRCPSPIETKRQALTDRFVFSWEIAPCPFGVADHDKRGRLELSVLVLRITRDTRRDTVRPCCRPMGPW